MTPPPSAAASSAARDDPRARPVRERGEQRKQRQQRRIPRVHDAVGRALVQAVAVAVAHRAHALRFVCPAEGPPGSGVKRQRAGARERVHRVEIPGEPRPRVRVRRLLRRVAEHAEQPVRRQAQPLPRPEVAAAVAGGHRLQRRFPGGVHARKLLVQRRARLRFLRQQVRRAKGGLVAELYGVLRRQGRVRCRLLLERGGPFHVFQCGSLPSWSLQSRLWGFL